MDWCLWGGQAAKQHVLDPNKTNSGCKKKKQKEYQRGLSGWENVSINMTQAV